MAKSVTGEIISRKIVRRAAEGVEVAADQIADSAFKFVQFDLTMGIFGWFNGLLGLLFGLVGGDFLAEIFGLSPSRLELEKALALQKIALQLEIEQARLLLLGDIT